MKISLYFLLMWNYIDHFHSQKKETQLDMMLDKLRQESSEEALKTMLDKINGLLGEMNQG